MNISLVHDSFADIGMSGNTFYYSIPYYFLESIAKYRLLTVVWMNLSRVVILFDTLVNNLLRR